MRKMAFPSGNGFVFSAPKQILCPRRADNDSTNLDLIGTRDAKRLGRKAFATWCCTRSAREIVSFPSDTKKMAIPLGNGFVFNAAKQRSSQRYADNDSTSLDLFGMH